MVNYKHVLESHQKDMERRLYNANKILSIVKRFHNFNSMLDIGCGIGAWLNAASKLGVQNIKGVEGPWLKETETLVDRKKIEVVDLSKKTFETQQRYDLAISIEVAEHLPEKMASNFCASLTNASDFVLFSAAIPGQGGAGHINEQYIEHWIGNFWNLGYVPLDAVRPFIQADKNMYWWLQQNVVVFVSYDRFIADENLHKFAAPLSSFTRISPIVFESKRKEIRKMKDKKEKIISS
ncbi:methyltransferase domain-containing protein [uncultured Roseibium sp.]|uniref:methyltransferase domain-containing protein n=1 Tax=uncultured Roseibium sp. TaxID=1936171 RepID=UPI002610E9B4|nr:methyltransferase domain-containing protein [uncultured Roseibium sp.]